MIECFTETTTCLVAKPLVFLKVLEIFERVFFLETFLRNWAMFCRVRRVFSWPLPCPLLTSDYLDQSSLKCLRSIAEKRNGNTLFQGEWWLIVDLTLVTLVSYQYFYSKWLIITSDFATSYCSVISILCFKVIDE